MTITLEPRVAPLSDTPSERDEEARGPVGLLGVCLALMPLLRPTLPGNSAVVDLFMLT